MFVQLVFYFYFYIFYIIFYFFSLSFSLKLSYSAAPNGLVWNFPVNFHYQRWLENLDMSSFGLTSLLTYRYYIPCFHLYYNKIFLYIFIIIPRRYDWLKPLTTLGENVLFFLILNIDQAVYVS